MSVLGTVECRSKPANTRLQRIYALATAHSPSGSSRLDTHLVPRQIAQLANEFLDSFRVLIINGPRQSGKTTLLHQLNAASNGTYVTLDDASLRAAAHADPDVFVTDGPRPLMIDEIQRGGDDLVLAIKTAVDRHPERGQFVLAGSTRFLSTPSLSESLAGRVGVLEVWPFAQEELWLPATCAPASPFLSAAFTDPEKLRSSPLSQLDRSDYFALIVNGGYPEPNAIRSPRARNEWYRVYVQAIIETDIREVAQVDEPSNLRRLLHLAAASTAQEFNTTKAANDLQLHRTTVTRYLGLLETVFLVRMLPAWSRNPRARATRRPKLHVTDTGLACHLLAVDSDGLAARVSPSRGPLVESFIVNELAKQATWAPFPITLHHWRQDQGTEVDVVLERSNGQIIGVEAKATDAVGQADFKGLARLRDLVGEEFVHGYVLYTGKRPLSFGDRLTALPIGTLWQPPAS